MTANRCRLLIHVARWCVLPALLAALALRAQAQQIVPGTGERLTKVGDDFEATDWQYKFNNPKNSYELDGNSRQPNGTSLNGRWFEGPLRGQPDVIERVATPAGGVPGSTSALLLRSLYTGTPGRPSGKNQQDDLIVNVKKRLGGNLPVSYCPNFVVRVYLPPYDQWEQRTGTTFAVRAGVWGIPGHPKEDSNGGQEEYWPGMIIHFQRADKKHPEPSASILVRAAQSGHDVHALDIEKTGWWTLGMSFTPQGQVEYYAHPGVWDLTASDYLMSQYPYGNRCRQFETFFFDVMNSDNGRTWSTTWIIDDPTLYVIRQPDEKPRPSVSRSPRRPAATARH